MLGGVNAIERQCPICRGPVEMIRVETGVPGMAPGRQRQTVKCSACGLIATQTFDLDGSKKAN